jgi:putative transcriptional regulator
MLPAAGLQSAATRDLAIGSFLVAARQIGDPNFREAVIVLIAYDRKRGAAGFIINRRTDVMLRRAVPDLPVPRGAQEMAFSGGPVLPDEARALWRSPLVRGEVPRVLPDTVLLGSRDALQQAIGAGASADRLRVYFGYSGWGPGQLEREIARGDWHVARGDSAVVFSPEPEGVWRQQIRLADVIVA